MSIKYLDCKVCGALEAVEVDDGGSYAKCVICDQEYEMVEGEAELVLDRDPPTLVARVICRLAGTGSRINYKVLYSTRRLIKADEEEVLIKLIEGLLEIYEELDGLSELTSHDVELLRYALDKLKESCYS
jgi:hypothetical protein